MFAITYLRSQRRYGTVEAAAAELGNEYPLPLSTFHEDTVVRGSGETSVTSVINGL